MKILSILILLLAISLPSLSHEIREGSALLQLEDNTFTRTVKAVEDSAVFIMFHSPNCGHCKRAMPEWTDFADEMKGKIAVASIDCTQNDFTRSRFEIQAYPTFYLLKGDKIYKYEGLRTISEWTRFVEDGYTYAESRPLPSLPPTDWEKAFAPFKQIYEQLKFLVFNKPLVFLSMVALVFIMTVFTIYVTSWLARKISEADEMEKEALRLEKAADEADAKAAAHQKKD